MPTAFVRITAVGRSDHPSVVSLAAYRAGERLYDARLEQTFDHSARDDVNHREILLPAAAHGTTAEWALDRATLWNRVQREDPGKRSRYAHEWMMVLPLELDPQQRLELARAYGQRLAERYGAAVDLAVHAPRTDGDPRNHHAHLLVTTRAVGPTGFGAKTDLNRRWPDLQRDGLPSVIKQWYGWREAWVEEANAALDRAGHAERMVLNPTDALGLPLPKKPGWSRAVEGVIRRGEDSPVAAAELKRYAFALERRDLELKAIALEQEAGRLALERDRQAEARRASVSTPPPSPTAVDKPKPDDGTPTPYAEWLAARREAPPYDPEAAARAAREAWQATWRSANAWGRAHNTPGADASQSDRTDGTPRREADRDHGHDAGP